MTEFSPRLIALMQTHGITPRAADMVEYIRKGDYFVYIPVERCDEAELWFKTNGIRSRLRRICAFRSGASVGERSIGHIYIFRRKSYKAAVLMRLALN